jgi:hypothetical protein
LKTRNGNIRSTRQQFIPKAEEGYCNEAYQEIMKLGNYRKQPYWVLHTYFGKC